MLITGFTLAVLTNVGFYLIYRKLPARMRAFMHKHTLMTDLTACLCTYVLFGGTLVALFASAWCGIMVSIMLAVTNNPDCMAFLEQLGQKLGLYKDKTVLAIQEYVRNANTEAKQMEIN